MPLVNLIELFFFARAFFLQDLYSQGDLFIHAIHTKRNVFKMGPKAGLLKHNMQFAQRWKIIVWSSCLMVLKDIIFI